MCHLSLCPRKKSTTPSACSHAIWMAGAERLGQTSARQAKAPSSRMSQCSIGVPHTKSLRQRNAAVVTGSALRELVPWQPTLKRQKRAPKPKKRTNSTKEFSEQFDGVTGHHPVKKGFWGESCQKVHTKVRQNLCRTSSLGYFSVPNTPP